MDEQLMVPPQNAVFQRTDCDPIDPITGLRTTLGVLQHKWTVWSHKNGDTDWNNVRPLLDFGTAGGFWSAFNWLGGVENDLDKWRRPQQRFCFFRSGIKPLYEDERAQDGGILSLAATIDFAEHGSTSSGPAVGETDAKRRMAQRIRINTASSRLWKQVAMECVGGVLYGCSQKTDRTSLTDETKATSVTDRKVWSAEAKNDAVIGFTIQFGMDHDGVLIKIWLACPNWQRQHRETTWIPCGLATAVKDEAVTAKISLHPQVQQYSSSSSSRSGSKRSNKIQFQRGVHGKTDSRAPQYVHQPQQPQHQRISPLNQVQVRYSSLKRSEAVDQKMVKDDRGEQPRAETAHSLAKVDESVVIRCQNETTNYNKADSVLLQLDRSDVEKFDHHLLKRQEQAQRPDDKEKDKAVALGACPAERVSQE
jgi:hypothetical protein